MGGLDDSAKAKSEKIKRHRVEETSVCVSVCVCVCLFFCVCVYLCVCCITIPDKSVTEENPGKFSYDRDLLRILLNLHAKILFPCKRSE